MLKNRFFRVVFFLLISICIIYTLGYLYGNTYTVNNTNDTNTPGTLRWAIIQANLNAGQDTILFNIPGPGLHTIHPVSQLPQLIDTAGLFINGLSQPGASAGPNPPATCILLVEINGANAGASHGFWILSPNNTIQGLIVDSFEQHGIRIQGIPNGTFNNLIIDNFVGIDSSGNIIRANGRNQNRFWGGVYIEVVPGTTGVAHDNTIQSNLISGNYAEGVGIANCPDGDVFANRVLKNYIGTDITGTLDRGNIHDGVYIGEGAHDNVVDSNLISGNDYEGVCIIGYPDNAIKSYANSVIHNTIGLTINNQPLPNTRDGVSLGIYGNYKGGYAPNNAIVNNTIAYNLRNGIVVWEHSNDTTNTDGNIITRNSIYDNRLLGIDLGDNGVTANDPNDPDNGPNQEVNFPVIQGASYVSGQTTITGTININTNPAQATVEVFKAKPDPTGYGEGQAFLGSVTPDAAGNWSITLSGLNVGDTVTATTTDMNNNTSEFCHNNIIVLGIEEDILHKSQNGSISVHTSPNPFSRVVKISFSIQQHGYVTAKIFDITGSLVKNLLQGNFSPERLTLTWNGNDNRGNRLSSGLYLLVVSHSGIQMVQTITLID